MHSANGVAAIGGARVLVVDRWRSAGDAVALAAAGFVAVACGGVVARRPDGERSVARPGRGIATVRRARIAIVDDWRLAGLTMAAYVTLFVAVATVGVGTSVAGVDQMYDAAYVAALVDGAGVAVVQRWGRSRGAAALGACLFAIAGVAVAARRAVGERDVLDAGSRIARISSARVVIVDVGRSPGLARTSIVTTRDAIAEVAVIAQGTFWAIDMRDPVGRITGVGSAGVSVVDNRHGAADASTGSVA